MERTINWGGVIKGVAVVAVAVLAGWAVFNYLAYPAIAAYLTPGSGYFGAEAVQAGLGVIGKALAFVGDSVVSIGSALGINDFLQSASNTISTNYHALAAGLTDTTKGVASSIGAGTAAVVAGGVTLKAGMAIADPHLTHMVDTSHVNDPGTMAKMGHAAHGHGGSSHPSVREAAAKSDGWVARTGGASSKGASFTEMVDASRANAAKVEI